MVQYEEDTAIDDATYETLPFEEVASTVRKAPALNTVDELDPTFEDVNLSEKIFHFSLNLKISNIFLTSEYRRFQ